MKVRFFSLIWITKQEEYTSERYNNDDGCYMHCESMLRSVWNDLVNSFQIDWSSDQYKVVSQSVLLFNWNCLLEELSINFFRNITEVNSCACVSTNSVNDRPIAHYRICLPRGQAFRFDQIKLLMFRNPVVDVRHNSSTFDMGSMKLKSRNASCAPWSIALHRILSIALFFDFFFRRPSNCISIAWHQWHCRILRGPISSQTDSIYCLMLNLIEKKTIDTKVFLLWIWLGWCV